MEMEQGFSDNVYTIDLSYVKTAAEIVFDLSSILDNEEASNKNICLKLGDIDLNQAQLLSIKSLINSINSSLSYVDTRSVQTENSALALGIIISNASIENIAKEEPEMTYKTIDEIIQSIDEQVSIKQTEEIVAPDESNEQEPIEVLEETISSTPREYEKIEISAQEEEKNETVVEEESQDIVQEDLSESVPVKEPSAVESEPSEIIQEGIDAIFNAEKKLEYIFEAEETKEESVSTQEQIYAGIVEEEKEYTEEDYEIDAFPVKYIKQTIRSGQVINFEGNIVIIGDCHPGSEIKASGDITVWGVLGGIAHAGALGNQKAKIRALKMNAIQLRISDCYARRPDSLNTIFVEKTNVFTPEEARIVNDEIVIFKIND